MNPYIFILGTLQDGGFTLIIVLKKMCQDTFETLKISKKS